MRITVALFLFLSFFMGNAQVDPKMVTSPVYKHNKPRIYMEEMLGEVNGVYYVMYSTAPVKVSTLPTLYINMYDKEDMTLIKTKPLIDQNNKNLRKKYKDFTLNNYLITKNGLQFFFKKKGKKGIRDIYLGTYDLKLNAQKQFEKVLNYNSNDRRFVSLANSNYPNTILATMNYADDGEKLFIEYKEIDKNFELVKRGKVFLPFEKSASAGKIFNRNRQAFARRLSLSDGGKIITSLKIKAETTMKTTKKGKRKKDKFADESYMSILVINPKTEDILEIPVKLDDTKNVDDFNWYADGKKAFVVGFYSNRTLERKGNQLHGVFYMRVDVHSAKTELLKTTKFTDDFLFRINNQNTLISKRAKKKENKKESINESFQISEVIIDMASKNITAYCEPIYNYYVQHTDQNGNTYTTYHSKRGSLFYFKMTEDGEFEHFNTIRKYSHWSSGSSSVWYRSSVFVHRGKEAKKDYILYSTQRIYNERDKSDVRGDKAKWKKTKRDFVIATINNKTGNYDLNYPQQYDKKDKKNLGILVDNISQSNGALYSYGIKRKMRISRLVTAVVLAVPTIFIAPYIIYVSPKSYYQKVQLNRIEIQDDSEGSDY